MDFLELPHLPKKERSRREYEVVIEMMELDIPMTAFPALVFRCRSIAETEGEAAGPGSFLSWQSAHVVYIVEIARAHSRQ